MILGSDLGALYTAALLSRCGKKVLVLEESNTAGNCTIELATTSGGGAGEEKDEKTTLQFVVGEHNLCKVLTPVGESSPMFSFRTTSDHFSHLLSTSASTTACSTICLRLPFHPTKFHLISLCLGSF